MVIVIDVSPRLVFFSLSLSVSSFPPSSGVNDEGQCEGDGRKRNPVLLEALG